MRTVNSPILVKSFWVVCYKYVFLQRQRNSRSHKPKSKFLFWVPNDTVSEICSLFSGRRAEKTISEISPDRILYIARIFLHLLLCSANHSAFQVGCQPTLKNVEAGDVRIRQEVKLKKDLSEREILMWEGVNNQAKKKENLVKNSIRWSLNEIQYLRKSLINQLLHLLNTREKKVQKSTKYSRVSGVYRQ